MRRGHREESMQRLSMEEISRQLKAHCWLMSRLSGLQTSENKDERELDVSVNVLSSYGTIVL